MNVKELRMRAACVELHSQLKAARAVSAEALRALVECRELRSQLKAIRLDRDEWRDRATKYETVHTDGSTTQSDLDVLRALARHLNRVCNSAKL